MDLQLRGKRALVTGGSRGIGKAVARALAREGCAVAVAARTADAVHAAAAEIGAQSGATAVGLVADTGDTASVERMVAAAAEALGGVDILVNSAAQPAGGGPPPALADISDEAALADINVKVLGYLRCARAVAPLMAAAGWGSIVSVGGLAARSTGSTVTSMRNAAVVALTKNLADELGRHGIRVTGVHPGATWTERSPDLVRRRAEADGVPVEEATRRVNARNAIRRVVTADDVAALVAFLASPVSVAVTGEVVAAGGGVGTAIHY
jgi:NAD(P)-dependent dehydrogenase (short-subunit alcohol dehydrogenase family)